MPLTCGNVDPQDHAMPYAAVWCSLPLLSAVANVAALQFCSTCRSVFWANRTGAGGGWSAQPQSGQHHLAFTPLRQARQSWPPHRDSTMFGTTALADRRLTARTSSEMSLAGSMSARDLVFLPGSHVGVDVSGGDGGGGDAVAGFFEVEGFAKRDERGLAGGVSGQLGFACDTGDGRQGDDLGAALRPSIAVLRSSGRSSRTSRYGARKLTLCTRPTVFIGSSAMVPDAPTPALRTSR